MTSYGDIIMIIVDSCMIWFNFDYIIHLKKSYHIATNVCSRKSATTCGDLPDNLPCNGQNSAIFVCVFRHVYTNAKTLTSLVHEIDTLSESMCCKVASLREHTATYILVYLFCYFTVFFHFMYSFGIIQDQSLYKISLNNDCCTRVNLGWMLCPIIFDNYIAMAL